MQKHVETALIEMVDAASLHGQAVLIGGQAMVDWYAWMEHCDAIPPAMGALGAPRTTTDIDILLDVRKNSPAAATLGEQLATRWSQDSEHNFRYYWKADTSVSLDLVCGSGPGNAGRVQQVRICQGSYIVRARVVPEQLLQAKMTTLCHRPRLADRGIARLDHSGLVGSKLSAVASSGHHLADAARDRREPAVWTERLDKDLQDLDRLLADAWIDRVCRWSFHVDQQKAERALRLIAQEVNELPLTEGMSETQHTKATRHARRLLSALELT